MRHRKQSGAEKSALTLSVSQIFSDQELIKLYAVGNRAEDLLLIMWDRGLVQNYDNPRYVHLTVEGIVIWRELSQTIGCPMPIEHFDTRLTKKVQS